MVTENRESGKWTWRHYYHIHCNRILFLFLFLVFDFLNISWHCEIQSIAVWMQTFIACFRIDEDSFLLFIRRITKSELDYSIFILFIDFASEQKAIGKSAFQNIQWHSIQNFITFCNLYVWLCRMRCAFVFSGFCLKCFFAYPDSSSPQLKSKMLNTLAYGSPYGSSMQMMQDIRKI